VGFLRDAANVLIGMATQPLEIVTGTTIYNEQKYLEGSTSFVSKLYGKLAPVGRSVQTVGLSYLLKTQGGEIAGAIGGAVGAIGVDTNTVVGTNGETINDGITGAITGALQNIQNAGKEVGTYVVSTASGAPTEAPKASKWILVLLPVALVAAGLFLLFKKKRKK